MSSLLSRDPDILDCSILATSAFSTQRALYVMEDEEADWVSDSDDEEMTPKATQSSFLSRLLGVRNIHIDSAHTPSVPRGSPGSSPRRPQEPSSSSGPDKTSPIKGTSAQKTAKRRKIGQAVRKVKMKAINSQKASAKALAQTANHTSGMSDRKAVMDESLAVLSKKGLVFRDLCFYIFDPAYKQGNIRLNGFFQPYGTATRILDLWVSPRNSEGAQEEVKTWAVQYAASLLRSEAKSITGSGVLQTVKNVVDGNLISKFSFTALYDGFEKTAPIAVRLFKSFLTSAEQIRKDSSARLARKKSVCATLQLGYL